MVGRKPPSMNSERAHTKINQKHQPASQRMQDCEQIMFSEILCHLLHQYFLHQFLSIHCARAPYSSKSFAFCTSKFPNGAARRSSDTMSFNEYYYESFIDAVLDSPFQNAPSAYECSLHIPLNWLFSSSAASSLFCFFVAHSRKKNSDWHYLHVRIGCALCVVAGIPKRHRRISGGNNFDTIDMTPHHTAYDIFGFILIFYFRSARASRRSVYKEHERRVRIAVDFQPNAF